MIISAALVACASGGARAPAPSAGDCETTRLWSNGFHTNIALRAALLDADHPLRTLFPEANYFLIGWGERDYYKADHPGFWMGLKAIVPPSPSVVHVIAGEEQVEDRIWPGDVLDIAVSREGARRLGRAIARSLAYEARGAPIVESEGKVKGASLFLRSREGFHLFYMCNHWTARVLHEAGVRVSPALSFTADGLMSAVRRKTARACPAD
jgi:uncharacterized protein (TIGR02117 family)